MSHAQTREQTVPEIVKNSSDAVVLIAVADSAGKGTRLGSGFLVSADGEIVTNYHVIQGAHSAVAKLANGAFFLVDGVLGVDADRDLAVLKVSGTNLPFLKLADSDTLQIGEHVVTIGSPLGLQNTVSDGIVSGVTEVAPKQKLIQTTAPLSSGNSGGPLLNDQGAVVGVIKAFLAEGQNLNFAVPIDQVRSLLSATEIVSLEAAASKKLPPENPAPNPRTASAQEILADAKSVFVRVRSGSPVLNLNRLGSLSMKQSEIQRFTSWLGKRSYAARVERFGIERIREIARENGKKGGRPPKKGNKQLSTSEERAAFTPTVFVLLAG